MNWDLDDIFEEYQKFAQQVDTVFQAVQEQCPDQVKCVRGCDDCCHALFDLSLVEAMYLNREFNRRFEGTLDRQQMLDRADEAERKQHKHIRKAHKAREKGEKDETLLKELAKVRIRCPLLGEESVCTMYEARPLTCRLYGIPMSIAGETHSCGLSGFEPGKPYPTVQVEKIQDRLVELSKAIQERIPTHYKGLATLHVPVSVALMTSYDDEYLGVRKKGGDQAESEAGDKPQGRCTSGGPLTWNVGGRSK